MKKTRERSLNDQKEKTTSMTFRLSPELKREYLEFCEKNGCSYGKKIRLLIQKELENE
jgi:hypothetical protein